MITENVGQQLAGLLMPASQIVDQQTAPRSIDAIVVPPPVATPTKKRRAKRGSSPRETTTNSNSVVDWNHNSSKWGAPSQAWTTAQKSLWVLYVVQQESRASELSGSAIANTFNKHFRQSGEIHPPNVTRDLGKLKTKNPSLVGENTTNSPTTWYLTDEGSKHVQTLIAGVKTAGAEAATK